MLASSPPSHSESRASPAAASVAADDVLIEYWAGNPSVEIAHGHIYARGGAAGRIRPDAVQWVMLDAGAAQDHGTAPPALLGQGGSSASSSAAAPDGTQPRSPPSRSPPSRSPSSRGADSSFVLVSTVPCYMSAPELCDFVGCFGEDSHRKFRHCRVLHGRSPEEYLIAFWMTSPEAAADLIEEFDGQRYNALEAGVCRMHRILGCLQRAPAPDRELPRTCSPCNIAKAKRGHSSSSSVPPAGAAPPSSGQLRSPVPQRAAGRPLGVSPLTGPMGSPVLRIGSPPGVPALQLDGSMAHALGHPEDELFHGCEALQHSADASDRSFCAVCREQMEADPEEYQLTELGGGLPLTILCGHTFHARCLSRWCDATCPLCRFHQHPDQTSCCDVCGQTDRIHICLVCGIIGCVDENGEGHAQQHFKATSHAYALEVSTHRVWDYAGNGYVHRLLYNHEDGKMVEHSAPPLSPTGSGTGELGLDAAAVELPVDEAAVAASPAAGLAEPLQGLAREDARARQRPGAKKQESVVTEFNALLSSQMTAQRRYYEEKEREQQLRHARDIEDAEARERKVELACESAAQRLSQAVERNAAMEKEIAALASDEEVMRRQTQQLEILNRTMTNEQRQFEERAESSRVQLKAQKQTRSQDIEELKQQIRDLELYVQMRSKMDKSTDEADRQGAHMFVTEAEQTRGRGRRGRRK